MGRKEDVMKKQNFEHKKMIIDSNYVEKTLSKMEREGWELISVLPNTTMANSVSMYWKRPCRLMIYPRPDTVKKNFLEEEKAEKKFLEEEKEEEEQEKQRQDEKHGLYPDREDITN